METACPLLGLQAVLLVKQAVVNTTAVQMGAYLHAPTELM